MAKTVMGMFRDIPIRRKLMLITMMGNCVALVLASSAFVIYEQFTYQETLSEEMECLVIAMAILLVVSLISWLVSSRLQRVISEPVASLAGVVSHVADSKDYSVRAVKQSEDELGRLIDGFNEMIFRSSNAMPRWSTQGRNLNTGSRNGRPNSLNPFPCSTPPSNRPRTGFSP